MAMQQEGKTSVASRINWKQALGLVVILAIGYVIVHFDAIILGYVLAVLALSAFFIVVGFDIGIPKRSVDAAPVENTDAERPGRAA